jgi:catechol 2,3-dioxygenase-like lactoylglutathione lyase family enzyme
MLRRLDHVQLAMPVGGEDDARRFYTGLLGLAEVPKPPALAVRGGCWFQLGDVKLHLGVEDSFRPARRAHPGIIVDDFADFVESLVRAGVTVWEGETLDGIPRANVDDPFGNRVELIASEVTSRH